MFDECKLLKSFIIRANLHVNEKDSDGSELHCNRCINYWIFRERKAYMHVSIDNNFVKFSSSYHYRNIMRLDVKQEICFT